MTSYVTAWVQGDLGTYLRNSVIYTAGAVVRILVASSLAGYALARLDFARNEESTSSTSAPLRVAAA